MNWSSGLLRLKLQVASGLRARMKSQYGVVMKSLTCSATK